MDAPAAFLPFPSPSLSVTPPYPLLRQSKPLVHLDNFGFGEAFHVDDLLDFPLDDAVSFPAAEEGSLGNFSQHSLELSVPEAGTFGLCGWSEKIGCRTAAGESVQVHEAGQPSASELCVPPDDLADQLEWLSAFVEDNSYTADATLAPLVSSGDLTGCKLESTTGALRTREAFQSPSPVSVLEQAGGTFSGRAWCLSPSLAVPGRARSKRSRTGSRVWSLDTLIAISVDNRLGSGDKVFIDCSGESYFSSPEQEADVLSVRSSKKTKRASVASKIVDISQPRKCGHCSVQKTPQWRAGPMGPKTLCNACGVRYKSGRLMPEYRPAGSPSFVSEVHSNSHKRILEMRRLKDFEAWEGHKPNGEDSNCMREAEGEALDVKPAGAGATTLEELALQTHVVEEDDLNRPRKKIAFPHAKEEEKQEEQAQRE